jgi:AcrR family transcriptional regulator
MARPRTQLLSRDIILDAALELIDKHHDFTILGIGKHLGVNPSSLYHHLSGGKDEIINSLRERFYRNIDLAALRAADVSWQSRIELWVRSYRAAVAQYPAAIPILIGRIVDDRPTLAIYEALAALLAEAGVPVGSQVGVIAMLDAVVFGSAIDAGSPVPLWDPAAASQPKLHAAITASDDSARVASGLTLAIQAAVMLVERLVEAPERD